MSTNMRTPCDSMTWSFGRDSSSMFRLYWKPEQPPGTTRTRRPAVSGRPSSVVINFLISTAAGSVTFKVTAGAVGAAVTGGVVVAGFADILVKLLLFKFQLLIAK